jgi:hypothetical protein
MEFQNAVIGRALFEPAARIAECLGRVEAAYANPACSECFPHSRNIYVKRCIFGNSHIGHGAVSVRENRHSECAKQNNRRPEAAIHLIANDHSAVAYGWHKDGCTFS